MVAVHEAFAVGQSAEKAFAAGQRAVAQLGSALEWGSRGRWFESSQPESKVKVGLLPPC